MIIQRNCNCRAYISCLEYDYSPLIGQTLAKFHLLWHSTIVISYHHLASSQNSPPAFQTSRKPCRRLAQLFQCDLHNGEEFSFQNYLPCHSQTSDFIILKPYSQTIDFPTPKPSSFSFPA